MLWELKNCQTIKNWSKCSATCYEKFDYLMTSAKRIRILSKIEHQDLYGVPVFDQNERLFFFQISLNEKITMECFKSIESRIYFLLQLGYFKAKSMFFTCPLSMENKDVQHILKHYFKDYTLPLNPINQRTCFDIQSRILQLFSWQRFDNNVKAKTTKMAVELVKICVDPRYIFDGLLDFLNAHQIVSLDTAHCKILLARLSLMKQSG